VGDPVEVRSIRDTFGSTSRDAVLHFSSIKGNIGHTEATAGVAGLIKVLLMMQHGKIPPQASHNSLNPKIPALAPDNIAIPRSLKPWKEDNKIALVNSYGAAGSNSAITVAQKPTVIAELGSASPGSKFPLIIAASSANSLVSALRSITRKIDTDVILSVLGNVLPKASRMAGCSSTKQPRLFGRLDIYVSRQSKSCFPPQACRGCSEHE
jgi:acyl transferase domain-containing protein